MLSCPRRRGRGLPWFEACGPAVDGVHAGLQSGLITLGRPNNLARRRALDNGLAVQ